MPPALQRAMLAWTLSWPGPESAEAVLVRLFEMERSTTGPAIASIVGRFELLRRTMGPVPTLRRDLRRSMARKLGARSETSGGGEISIATS